MKPSTRVGLLLTLFSLLLLAAPPTAPGQPEKEDPADKKDRPPFGGFGGPMGQTRKLVKQFDKDGDGRLNTEERKAAREFLKKEPRGGGRGPGGRGGFGPGGFLARPLMEALDTEKDSKA